MVEVGLGLASANPPVRRGEPGEGLHHAVQPPPPKKDPREDQEGPRGGPGKKEEEQEEEPKIRVVSLKPTKTPGPTKMDKPEGTPGERHSEAKGYDNRVPGDTFDKRERGARSRNSKKKKKRKRREETGKRLELNCSKPLLSSSG